MENGLPQGHSLAPFPTALHGLYMLRTISQSRWVNNALKVNSKDIAGEQPLQGQDWDRGELCHRDQLVGITGSHQPC
jgi:hypothetical protein